MKRRKLEVRVESPEQPLNVDQWIKLYVGHVLALEKIETRVQTRTQMKKAG